MPEAILDQPRRELEIREVLRLLAIDLHPSL
jgi:hypothetical protein